MKSTQWIVIVLPLLILILANCAPSGAPQGMTPEEEFTEQPVTEEKTVDPGKEEATAEDIEVLTVWHAWQGTELEALEEMTTNYKEKAKVVVELVQFKSPSALFEKLLDTSINEGPDVFLGYHTWGNQLLDHSLVNAYCLPNQCPECKGENSPLWCQFASGDFSYRLSDDFLISALCEPGQCPECEGENPPFWCQFATGGIETKLDVFHAAFAIPVNGDIFPLGIPIWWEYVGIFANPEWHQEQELKLPATLEEVNEIVEEFKSIYYAADYFSRTGLRNPIPASAEPDVEPIMPGIESPDPDVDPVMPGILVASSDEFVQLQESIGNLTLLSLEDYRPQILVHGAYMNANTQKRSQALDFVYTLASEEAQYLLFEKTGHLPAHGEVLAEIDGSVARNLVQFGKNGRLAVLPSEN